MTWLLKGGRVVDPAAGVDGQLDVLLADGAVRAVGRNLPAAEQTLDCRGKYVLPGLIDMGSRVGEPGFEHRETVASATRAAAAGGFTALCALPDAEPVTDTPQGVRFLLDRAQQDGVVRLYPVAALTKGGLGRELTETGALKESGAVALAASRAHVDGGLLRRALQYAGMFQLPVLLRGVDESLADGGVMHEGTAATMRGLPGIPGAAEEAAVARCVILAQLTGVPIHVQAVSTAGAVDIIGRAKERGVPVTASVSAQQLVFTDEDVRADDTHWKTEPPFRGRDDVQALRRGVVEGVIDVIFSDHSPWSREEKDVEFDVAPFGMIGLETALSLVFGELVHPGVLTMERLVDCMSLGPARILGLAGGSLQPGAPGDVTVLDPTWSGTFDAARGYSLSRNTPVHGRRVTGRAAAVFVGGRLIMRDGAMIEG